MNLKAKLSRLRVQSGGACEPSPTASAASELRRRLAGIGTERLATGPRHSPPEKIGEEALAQRLRGYRIAEGVIQIQRRLVLGGELGRQPLSLLRNTLRLPGEGREAHLRQLYIDTETNGLSGGSGTLAFLVGVAAVEGDALVVTQYLLTRFAGEAAMLAALVRAMTPDDRLVSYNGKSFDLPLLTTRCRMQGEAHPFDELPHLDLLHPVRRLFARRWPDCRLITLEDRLLGFRRRHDLPGAEAPAAWSGYLRQGRVEPLIRVVEHNRQDILSLAMAHAVLVRAVAAPQSHGVDIASLAHWLFRFDRSRAYTLLKSFALSLDDRGKRLLGRLASRDKDWSLAVPLWEALAGKGCRHSLEQLAKYHEHVSRDLDVARHYCEQLKPGPGRARRLRRIEDKQYRQRLQPGMACFR